MQRSAIAPGDGVPISPTWARDACRCSECRHPGNGQHLIDITDLAGWRVDRVERQPDAWSSISSVMAMVLATAA